MRKRLKAKIHSVIINYKCPNCFLTFQLQDIPKEIFNHKCDSCWEELIIEPLVSQKDTVKDNNVKQAISSLVSLGWTKEDSKSMVKSIDIKGKTKKEIILLALQNKGKNDDKTKVF
ncbi:MAG: hypothetical protein HWN81_09965 [Candidatus Lokiarchaeota archaeon]|jgi:hypothetical protein|nr:hypothetical protein [Candidatus Lokiarchaeota archaeon]